MEGGDGKERLGDAAGGDDDGNTSPGPAGEWADGTRSSWVS